MDKFAHYDEGLNGPITSGFDITPDDAANLQSIPRAVMVAGSGDLAVEWEDGTQVVLPALQPGAMYPVRPKKVLTTGTTATGIVGLY